MNVTGSTDTERAGLAVAVSEADVGGEPLIRPNRRRNGTRGGDQLRRFAPEKARVLLRDLGVT